MNFPWLLVDAQVYYWEDAILNGVEDVNGELIPFRCGWSWKPIIDLREGRIVDWPEGMTADIYYKVCDGGLYFLADEHGDVVWQWAGRYVPDAYLCHGDRGNGDYIILGVDGDGRIQDWHRPESDLSQWKLMEGQAK